MRYPKGTVLVKADRDIPLLLHVRNAKFISHQQLFELMRFSAMEYSRDSFTWRVRRLVADRYLERFQGEFGYGSAVYRITRRGLIQLESHSQFATVLNSKTLHLPHPSHAPHALELNAVRLALLHQNLLLAWKTDVEIASENTVSIRPLEKDYDAIVDVWNQDNAARFALEYERTLKNLQQYDRVRQALEAEDSVNCILYLTSGEEITRHLSRELSGIQKRLAFATAKAFRESLLDTQVLVIPGQPLVPFRSLLHGVF